MLILKINVDKFFVSHKFFLRENCFEIFVFLVLLIIFTFLFNLQAASHTKISSTFGMVSKKQ
jgi:hypothetical protein